MTAPTIRTQAPSGPTSARGAIDMGQRTQRQPKSARPCHNCPKPKGPVLENTIGNAVATPTDKRGFVMSELVRFAFARAGMVYGHGGGYPQGRPHGFTRVLNHHAHPSCFKTRLVDSEPRKGVPTMTNVITLARAAAPIISLASRRAAPIKSITDTTDRDTIALHVQAENALAMALSMLRNPQGTAADLERATARACRAATLLKRACAAQTEGAAA